MEKLLQISEKKSFELEDEDAEINSVKNELLLETIINLQISKHFYSTM